LIHKHDDENGDGGICMIDRFDDRLDEYILKMFNDFEENENIYEDENNTDEDDIKLNELDWCHYGGIFRATYRHEFTK
jgi:hypothetical protein